MNGMTLFGFALINTKYGLFIKLVNGKPYVVGYSHINEVTLFNKEEKAKELLPEIGRNFELSGDEVTVGIQKDMVDESNWEVVKAEIEVRFVD